MKNPIIPPFLQFVDGSAHGTRLPPLERQTLSAPRSHKPWPGWLLLLVGVGVIVAVAGLTRWRQGDRESAKTNKAISQTLTSPEPAQTPLRLPAPRAVLIKLPVPRAQLIRMPEWQVGQERQLLLPSGLKVLGRLRGKLASTDMLPSTGNTLSDTWIVGDNAYVWLCPIGSSAPTWIDP
jgi:hypothetical protein